MLREPECIWNPGTELGEGPLWLTGEQAVWFVDIKKQQVHRFDARIGQGTSWSTPAPVGFLAPLPGGRFIAGLKTGLHTFDPHTGIFTPRYSVEHDLPDNRLNDGAVDPFGRLWFGSMDDGEEKPTGRLYRLDDGGPVPMDAGYVITNGPAFSPDGSTLYHNDTLERLTYAFDLSADGSLANKRVFARYDSDAGYPDGPVVDAEGCIWIAFYGGWGVRRYSPQGALLEKVRFPCANITKIAFGGPDLTTAYATTAWKGLSADERKEQPLAGGLFRFEVDVPGQPQQTVHHG